MYKCTGSRIPIFCLVLCLVIHLFIENFIKYCIYIFFTLAFPFQPLAYTPTPSQIHDFRNYYCYNIHTCIYKCNLLSSFSEVHIHV